MWVVVMVAGVMVVVDVDGWVMALVVVIEMMMLTCHVVR